MPTDSYGQSIPYLDYTDVPDFNAWGKALVAALAPIATMRFASASARDATLTGAAAPVAGMRCWLGDVKRWYGYDGTTWSPEAVLPDVSMTPLASLLNTAGGVSDNGNSEGTLGARVITVQGLKKLELQGGAALATDPGAGSVRLLTLPSGVGMWPSSRRTAGIAKSIDNGIATTKIDINTNGDILAFGTFGSATTWVSLNNVSVYL